MLTDRGSPRSRDGGTRDGGRGSQRNPKPSAKVRTGNHPVERRGRAESGSRLGDRPLEILDFERTWWLDGGAKEPAIRATFDVSAARYYQLLSRLIDSPEAYAYDPLVVLRLRRQRDRRRRARYGATPVEGGPQR